MSSSIEPATPERWDDLATVMGTRGDPATCWCQFFRMRGEAWKSSTRESKRAGLREQVDEFPPGLIAYRDGEPAGWCAVAPKEGYPGLLASRVSGEAVSGVWSISCFVVRPEFRQQGVATDLLSEAVEFARAHGAAVVEGYPIDVEERPQASSADLYHGPLSAFLAAGFDEVDRPMPGRPLVRLRV